LFNTSNFVVTSSDKNFSQVTIGQPNNNRINTISDFTLYMFKVEKQSKAIPVTSHGGP
jgi:hypothetical protein